METAWEVAGTCITCIVVELGQVCLQPGVEPDSGFVTAFTGRRGEMTFHNVETHEFVWIECFVTLITMDAFHCFLDRFRWSDWGGRQCRGRNILQSDGNLGNTFIMRLGRRVEGFSPFIYRHERLKWAVMHFAPHLFRCRKSIFQRFIFMLPGSMTFQSLLRLAIIVT